MARHAVYIPIECLNWVRQMCVRRNITPERISQHLARTSMGSLISWEDFEEALDNLNSLSDSTELFAAGIDSWDLPAMQQWIETCRIIFNPLQCYSAAYGVNGFCSGVYPVDTSITSCSEKLLTVSLTFRMPPPEALLHMLAGQMSALPGQFGLGATDVQWERESAGIRFNIRKPPWGIVSRLRQQLSRITATRQLAVSAARSLKYQVALQRSLILAESSLLLRENKLSKDGLSAPEGSASDQGMELVNQTDLTLMAIDDKGTIVNVQGHPEKLFGYKAHELLHTSIHRLIPGPLANSTLNAFLSGESDSATIAISAVHKDQQIVPVDLKCFVSGNGSDPVRWLIARDDSTQQHTNQRILDLEQQLSSAQKLAGLGQLTGEMIHDFNNLLIVARSHAELLEEGLESDSQASHLGHLKEIKQAATRGTDLTRQLLDFSRGRPTEQELIHVTGLLMGMEQLVGRLMPGTIKISFSASTADACVMGNRTQLEQVIMNLVINARDAMPEGGELRVGSTLELIDNQSQVQIEVADTGTGMDEATIEKIFQPLFSTKASGRGTGLGLSVVSGNIRRMGGSLGITSTPGRGSTFRILLPIAGRLAPLRKMPETGVTSHSSRVLIIEENPQVREVIQLVLVSAGYEVPGVSDSAQALETFRRLSDQLDLVVMNVVLSGEGSEALFHKIRYLAPDIRVLFVSGYADDTPAVQFVVQKNLPLIRKPFGIEGLRLAVSNLLSPSNSNESAAG